ncbi:MAG: SprT-like domain-containing protein [Muribaculaceae bacterium]|nr:SprT-like domain-containing protein [Muribaculaceae bacterium]
MKLEIEYLRERHHYWIYRIGERGIWNPLLFEPVQLVIRKDCRSYNALFHRKVKIKKGVKETTDKIIIYNKVEDFDPKFLDTILVHEMIHQYIFQSEQKDTSTHGRLFKYYMNRINKEFEGELNINIRDRNPAVKLKGPGDKLHTLLLIQYNDGNWFCAVVMPTRVDYFERMLKQNMKIWKMKTYQWAQSNDVYFNQYSRCTKVLHGIKKSEKEMSVFINELNIKPQVASKITITKSEETRSLAKRRFNLLNFFKSNI